MTERFNQVSIQRLHELFIYDRQSGNLIWKIDRRSGSGRLNAAAGTIASCLKDDGYKTVSVDHKTMRAQRVIWAMETGAWPDGVVDHINGDPSDNRIENLREATRAQNAFNARKKKHNKSGYKGVHYDKRIKRFIAQIRANGIAHYLGTFKTAEDAYLAYCNEAKRLHGDFAKI